MRLSESKYELVQNLASVSILFKKTCKISANRVKNKMKNHIFHFLSDTINFF